MSILPFIGPRLEVLDLDMADGIDNPEQSQLMQSLAHRRPNLKSLWLTSSSNIHNMSTPLATLISSSPNLIHLGLPAFFLTPEVVATAARLPLLKTLDCTTQQYAEDTYQESGMSFEFAQESFPQLETIEFAALPTRMATVLQATDHVGRLISVSLDCPAYDSPQEIKIVFANLSAAAKRIQKIQLVCCPINRLVGSSSKDSLSINTIRPLLSCTQLAHLHITAPHFIPLAEGDVVEMGNSWPEMRTLALSPSPLLERDRGTSFNILPAFAKHFPDLLSLHLFFSNEIPTFDGDLNPAYQFGGLATLGVGWTSVPRGKAREIGFLLASLCRRPPYIHFGKAEYHRGIDPPGESTTYRHQAAGWSQVRLAIDLAFRAKNSNARKLGAGDSDTTEYEQKR
ncbi:hypothetical protein FRC04_001160 [Tulasnella sp. 424]|nr:hypothetical protein FRC04_001160 [Tulasnella sp. 424]